MKITQTEIFVLGDPAPPHPVDDHISRLAFLRIHTDEGVTGLSEIFAVPPEVSKAVLDGPDSFFGHILVGEDPIAPERLWQKLYNSMMHGNRRGWAIICIGAVDVALWDIFGKACNRPVYQLLGGSERASAQTIDGAKPRQVIPYGTIISQHWDHKNVLREQVERAVTLCEAGFRALKVEPMYSEPKTIVELAQLTREAIGPERILAVDVGYLWNDVGLATQVMQQLVEYNVFFLETPFPVDSLQAYARLAEKTPLRIAAGEHTTTRWEFLDLLDRGRISVAQPWITTCGGLTEARRIVELAQPRGALVCPGNWSTQVLGAASVHLAAYSPVTPIIEYAPAQIYWSPLRKAIQEIGLPLVDGVIALPGAPGIGVELPADLIAHFRIA
jgi:L-alanine-DL-glutamate epimerase-like enolase superfamily enzyme